MMSHNQIEHHAERYRRLKYALPRGTRFYDYLQRPGYYNAYALDRLRDWSENPRLAALAHHTPILIN